MKINVCSSSWFREIFLKLQMYRKSGAFQKDFNFIVRRTCYNLRTNDKLQGTMVLGWFNVNIFLIYVIVFQLNISLMYYCENIFCVFMMMYVLFLSHVEKFCTQWITRKKEKKKRVQGHKCPESIQTFRLLWKWVKVAVKRIQFEFSKCQV